VVDSAIGAKNDLIDASTKLFEGITTFISTPDKVIPGYSAAVKAYSALENSRANSQPTDWTKIISDFEELPHTPPFANVLSSYSSFNYIFTLSSIDDYMLNYPNETYKSGDLGQIILKSGSGDYKNRVVIEGFGVFEFYIDDVEISSIVGFQKTSGNTNAASLKFKIIEPYSMGMFFHAIQAAANHTGHENYINAVYLLTLQFMGHVSSAALGISGDSLTGVEKTTKHFPIKITAIDMRVTANGAEYNIAAVPYNQLSMSTSYAELKTDVAITGKTVQEILQSGKQSLQAILNDRAKQVAKQNNLPHADEIVIYFPYDLGSGLPSIIQNLNVTKSTLSVISSFQPTQSVPDKLKLSVESGGNNTLVQKANQVNAIGKSSMNFDPFNSGNSPFQKSDLVYDKENHIYTRGNMTCDANAGELKFTQESNIINVINQVIVMSTYGNSALSAKKTKSGKIPWWRVEPQMYQLPTDDNTSITGMKPRLIVYRVVPYDVDSSTFLPPDKAMPQNLQDAAKKQAVKEYNYIYTGLNTEVMEFEIFFNNTFYTSMFANAGKNSGDAAMADRMATVAKEPESTTKKEETLSSKIFGAANDLKKRSSDFISEIRHDKTSSSNSGKGGAGLNNPDTLLAKQAHDLIVTGFDNAKPHMKILGDPYFIADSGWGNYTAKPTNYENINSDHSMDYQSGEVDILVNFRTPLDINVATGKADFGNTTLISQFSGLYKVYEVSSNFSKGKFTQDLTLMRRPGQV
jgi:hypothetical protein